MSGSVFAPYRGTQPAPPRAELERSFREAWLPPKAMGLLATVYKSDTPLMNLYGRMCGR